MRIILIAASLILVAFLAGSRYSFFEFRGGDAQSPRIPRSTSEVYAAGTKEQFDFLSQQTSSSCGLQPTSVDDYSDDQRIQGACCSAMNFHRYQEQVEGLKRFADIPQIPEDPYDVPVSLAKELFDYQKVIQLTKVQQDVYELAVEISHEGGPCCCKCWRWYAFEGLAKFLISEYNWGAEQISEVWDLLDGCGGSGH